MQKLNARRKVISILRDRRLVDEEQEFTGQSVVQKLFTDIERIHTMRPKAVMNAAVAPTAGHGLGFTR